MRDPPTRTLLGLSDVMMAMSTSQERPPNSVILQPGRSYFTLIRLECQTKGNTG